MKIRIQPALHYPHNLEKVHKFKYGTIWAKSGIRKNIQWVEVGIQVLKCNESTYPVVYWPPQDVHILLLNLLKLLIWQVNNGFVLVCFDGVKAKYNSKSMNLYYMHCSSLLQSKDFLIEYPCTYKNHSMISYNLHSGAENVSDIFYKNIFWIRKSLKCLWVEA